MSRRFYWRYLIQDFGVVSIGVLLGAPLVLFGAAFGAWHWVKSVQSGVPATAGTVFVAALPIILGVQLLLVASGARRAGIAHGEARGAETRSAARTRIGRAALRSQIAAIRESGRRSRTR